MIIIIIVRQVPLRVESSMFYHIRIAQRSNKSHEETKLDLTEKQLRDRFIQPYELGHSILINGKTIPSRDIERIRVARSQENSEELIAAVRAEDRASSIAILGGSYEWRAAEKADDITDEFIRGPVGYKAAQISKSKAASRKVQPDTSQRRRRPGASSKRVFVVHGHDHALKNDLEVLLHNIGLEPVVIHRQVDRGQTLIEKIENNSDVAYTIVLMTPDDCGTSAEHFKVPGEDTYVWRKEQIRKYVLPELRARQNVIFEFGYFAGLLGRDRVCCIIKEGVVFPSDLHGFVYKVVKEKIDDVANPLIRELQHAGLDAKLK
jgi:predicted nucleotide-binding protein